MTSTPTEMSDDEHDLTAHRVTSEPTEGATFAAVEMGIDYTDGWRVTVGWSESDQTWYARCRGEDCNELGHGDTKQEALLCLICAMACHIHALYETERGDKRKSA